MQQLHVLGVLALERDAGAPEATPTLAQAQAGALAALVARDLAKLVPEAAALDLVTVGAHYDPVEVLRAGWPLHRELDALAARAPRAGIEGGRVIAFGTHAGQLPGVLVPDAAHAAGPMRLVPFVLSGERDVVARVGDACEQVLLERGMAGADTALAAQEAFALRVEHARYMTVHDLAAMTALQYEHAGLAPLWPLLETALLAPDEALVLDHPPEPRVRYDAGTAHIALFAADAWRARCAPDETDSTRLARMFAAFEGRQRQYAAVLGAHGVDVVFEQA